MSAHGLLNLLNDLGKRDKMRGLPSILSLFPNEFNKFNDTRARMLEYFIPQAPTSDLTSSRKDVKHLVFFQILQNADNFLLLSDNSAVILFSKVYWFDSLNSFLSFKINKYSFLTGATFPSSKDDFCACG